MQQKSNLIGMVAAAVMAGIGFLSLGSGTTEEGETISFLARIASPGVVCPLVIALMCFAIATVLKPKFFAENSERVNVAAETLSGVKIPFAFLGGLGFILSLVTLALSIALIGAKFVSALQGIVALSILGVLTVMLVITPVAIFCGIFSGKIKPQGLATFVYSIATLLAVVAGFLMYKSSMLLAAVQIPIFLAASTIVASATAERDFSGEKKTNKEKTEEEIKKAEENNKDIVEAYIAEQATEEGAQ